MTAASQQPDDALAILRRIEPLLAGIAIDIAVLKTDVAGLKSDVAGLKSDVVALKVDVAYLKGQVGQLPTWWQMLSMIVGLVFAVSASAYGLLRGR